MDQSRTEYETGVTYAYDALGRKVTREEALWAENRPQGKAWGLQKEPGEKAVPATEGKGNSNGKGGKSAATEESAAAVEEEPVTCPEGTVPVEVHGNVEKGQKGNGKAAKPLKKETQTTRHLYDGLTSRPTPGGAPCRNRGPRTSMYTRVTTA